MNLLSKMIGTIAALIMVEAALAQNVSNVDANQEGKSIAITYDLQEISTIKVFYTDNGGRTRTEIPSIYLSGDVGRNVSPGNNRKVLWHVMDQYANQDFHRDDLSFIVEGQTKMRLFASLNMGYALDSGLNAGFSLGQLGRMGWYGRVMSTFSLPKDTVYECDENGAIGGILPAYSGYASSFRAYAVAGAIFKLFGHLYLNTGLGYGIRCCYWETTDGKWVKNAPGSYNGLSIDAGVIMSFSHVALSVGVTLLNWKPDINLGIGYCF